MLDLIMEQACRGVEEMTLASGDFYDLLEETADLRRFSVTSFERDASPSDCRRDVFRFHGPRGLIRVVCATP